MEENLFILKKGTQLSLKNVEDQIKAIRGSRHMDSLTLKRACKHLKNTAKI